MYSVSNISYRRLAGECAFSCPATRTCSTTRIILSMCCSFKSNQFPCCYLFLHHLIIYKLTIKLFVDV